MWQFLSPQRQFFAHEAATLYYDNKKLHNGKIRNYRVMALIGIATYCTDANKRVQLLEKTLHSIINTVDFSRHRLIVADNGSCYDAKKVLKYYQQLIPNMKVITFSENQGTAIAINACWKERREHENCAKVDDDILFNNVGWLDILEDIVNTYPLVGQAACKRRDCAESPNNTHPFYQSELIMLPHESGQKWYACERVSHTMGSALLHSYRLIDKIGGLFQIQGNKYGFDDSAMSARSYMAGFMSVFVCNIDIEHCDVDGDDGGYTEWKHQNASEKMAAYSELIEEYKTGKRELYHEL